MNPSPSFPIRGAPKLPLSTAGEDVHKNAGGDVDKDAVNLFRCDWPECTKKFQRRYDLESHRSLHQPTTPFWCTVPGCHRSESYLGPKHPFPRVDKLASHMRYAHGPNVSPSESSTLLSSRFLESSQPDMSKHVTFYLLLPPSPLHRPHPIELEILPNDTADSIITTLKNACGICDKDQDIVLKDHEGNVLAARYEDFRHAMVVFVRAAAEEPDISTSTRTRAPPIDRSRNPIVDSNGEYIKYSGDDGNDASTAIARRSVERMASADISLDNIVEGGRRKPARFDSSELRLFVPPQDPMTALYRDESDDGRDESVDDKDDPLRNQSDETIPDNHHEHSGQQGPVKGPALVNDMEQASVTEINIAEKQHRNLMQAAPGIGSSLLNLPSTFHDQDLGTDERVYLEAHTDSGYGSAAYKHSHVFQHSDNPLIDDAATTYTQESDLNSTIEDDYVSEFAKLIFESLGPECLDSEPINKIHSCLEQLLKTLALRLGHSAKSMAMLNLMVFIYRHRRDITEAFRNISSQNSDSPVPSSRTTNGMSFSEKVNNWDLSDTNHMDLPSTTEGADMDDENPIGIEEEGEGEEEEEKEDLPEVSSYRKFIKESGAYGWFLSELRCKILLSTPKPNIRADIRDSILTALPFSHRISRRRSPETFEATFTVEWEPLAFLNEQQYKGERNLVFETAITLTGSMQDLQAVTCGHYLRQTWPLIGECTLRVLKRVVQSSQESRHTIKAPDGTQMTAWIQFRKVMVEVLGTRDSIAEVGEQLAWLGSAMRSSPAARGPVYCHAQVNNVRSRKFEHAREAGPSIKLSCSISFMIEPPEVHSGNGRCWHELFRNPVIAKGFPIPCRLESNTGMEIPLHIMAGLAQARRATTFNGRLCIKGFSTMLLPTRKIGNLTIWHLLYNEDGRRLSYLDSRISDLQDPAVKTISVADLEDSQHVLGWSSSVQICAGTSDGKYDVHRSGFSSHVAGCVLEKVSISAGKIVTAGASFSVGIKDIPLHLRPDGSYKDQIEDAYSNYVILYDADTKRAWLVNGATALLYIVRTSLEDSRRGKFKSQLLFRPDDLKEMQSHLADSAIDVLISRANMELKIAHDKDEIWTEVTENKDGTVQEVVKRKQKFVLFQDLVEQKWHILEQILDQQSKMNTPGVRLKVPGREHLEGFDFTDVATRVQDLRPRATTLQSSGKGWVDFARSIRSITLFGRGFGEVIRPAENSNKLCRHWEKIPKGMDYLTVSISDLEEISKRRGNPHSSPMRLVENICWHKPDKLFESCKCKPNTMKRKFSSLNNSCDRVQVLLPSTSRFRRIISPGPLDSMPKGAVIFGHSSIFPLRWRDQGDPEEGEPTPPPEDSESLPNDSGLGSSIGPSEAEETVSYKRGKSRKK